MRRRQSAAREILNGLLMSGHDADLMVWSIFFFPHLLWSVRLHVHTANRSSRLLAAGPPVAGGPASLRSDAIQLHSLYARWVSEETPNCGWRSSTLACLSLPISLHFSHHNGANVQPCGQLTARLRALCKLYDGETIVCFARHRNEVVLGRALLLTLIYDELLMINRVGDCIYCSPVGWCGGFLLHLYS